MIENEGATAEVETLETPIEKSMDDTIRETLRDLQDRGIEPDTSEATEEEKPAKVRDDKGKFKNKEVVKADEQVVTEVLAETEVQAKEAPSSWRKEAKEKFSTLPPEIQDEVLKREQDIHKGVENYKQYAQYGQEFEKSLQPYMATINQMGVHPAQAAQSLFRADHALRYGNEAQKADMVSQIFRDYGINPQSVFDRLQGQPQVDPNVSALYQKIGSLEAQQQQWVQSQQQNELAALNSQLSEFSKDKPHYESVRLDMAALLQANRAQSLQDAYDQAVWANPTTRASMIAEQQKSARLDATQKAQLAKQAASVNVRTRPSMPVSEPITTMDETIRATLRRLQGS